MKLDIVVSYKIFIRNFEGATILGPVIDDVGSFDWKFLLAKQIIIYTVGK